MLPGARRVLLRLSNPTHKSLSADFVSVEDGWHGAQDKLRRAGFLKASLGMEVMLLDHAPYTARCWDDDRLWIHVRKLAKEDDRGASVLVHEFGHRIWFQHLSDAQREAWWRGFDASRKTCSLVSAYACTDELENFAEVFRAHIYGTLDRENKRRWVALSRMK